MYECSVWYLGTKSLSLYLVPSALEVGLDIGGGDEPIHSVGVGAETRSTDSAFIVLLLCQADEDDPKEHITVVFIAFEENPEMSFGNELMRTQTRR